MSNRELEITIEEFAEIIKKPCFYCLRKMPIMGMDRVDNNQGYLKTNVETCCSDCNLAKRVMPQKDFILLCNLIAKNHPL